MTAHDFGWFAARLDVPRDQWNEIRVGKRDLHTSCPVHAGEGPKALHVTEKGTTVLTTCFARECSFESLRDYLEDDPQGAQDDGEPAKSNARREPRPAYTAGGLKVADQVWRSGRWQWDPALKPRGISPSDLHGGLQSLVDHDPTAPVVLTEGHGPAIALNDAGIPAIAVVTGKASELSRDGAAMLYGLKVILSPDNASDDTARQHMERNGAVLEGIASSVLMAPSWPRDFPDNGDAADYIANHGADAMRDFYAASTPWTSAPVNGMVAASDVVPRKVEWLWPNRIAFGKLTILDGRPGIFKSGQMFDIAARVTRKSKLPDGDTGVGPYNVIIVSGEDDPDDTIVPRLMAAGADLTRVHFWDALSLPDEVDELRKRIVEVGARFVMVDPLVAFVQGKYNLYHDQQSRIALRPLAQVARDTTAAIVGLRHVKKPAGQNASGQDAGAGSVAIGGAARSNLLAGADPDDPETFILASIKNNLGPKPPSLRYHIEEVAIDTVDGPIAVPAIRWGAEVLLTADDLTTSGEKRGAAVEFLEDLLADGPVPATDVEKACKQSGLSYGGAVKRAADRMGIVKAKDGMTGGWTWTLPS